MYDKYRVTAYCKNGHEIETQVFDGMPEQVVVNMIVYLADKGIIASTFELDRVTYEAPYIR